MDFQWTLVFFAAFFAVIIGFFAVMDYLARKAEQNKKVPK